MIYDNVKSLCMKQGLTIMELERKSGLSNGTIGGWRQSKPLADSLFRVASVLNVTVEELMQEKEEVNN